PATASSNLSTPIERIAHDRREIDLASSHADVLVHHVFEILHGHELLRPLHLRIRAENASRVADVGSLDVEGRRPGGDSHKTIQQTAAQQAVIQEYQPE